MLHPLVTAAGGDRLIKRIVKIDPAELSCIPGAKPRDRLLVQENFACRAQVQLMQLACRALRLRVERADRLQRIAEVIQPDRLVCAWSKQIYDTAANSEISGIDDRAGAVEAVRRKERKNLTRGHDIPGLHHKLGLVENGARRHSLHHRVHGRYNYGWGRMFLTFHQGSEGRQALRNNICNRGHAVVWQAIPCRKSEQCDVGGKKGQGLGKAGQALVVSHDVKVTARCCAARQIRQHHCGHAGGNTGEEQAPGLFEKRTKIHQTSLTRYANNRSVTGLRYSSRTAASPLIQDMSSGSDTSISLSSSSSSEGCIESILSRANPPSSTSISLVPRWFARQSSSFRRRSSLFDDFAMIVRALLSAQSSGAQWQVPGSWCRHSEREQ